MTITKALYAAALYVEEHKAALAWNGPEMPSEGEKAIVVAEVSALGHELESLAAASETARVYPREYEAIRDELQRRGFFIDPEIVQAIAHAFHQVSVTQKAASARCLPRLSAEQAVAEGLGVA